MGHFARVCRSAQAVPSCANALTTRHLATIYSGTNLSSLADSLIQVKVNGTPASALVDSGSSESFINSNLVNALSLDVIPSLGNVILASSSHVTPIQGHCSIQPLFNQRFNSIQFQIKDYTPAGQNLCIFLIFELEMILEVDILQLSCLQNFSVI